MGVQKAQSSVVRAGVWRGSSVTRITVPSGEVRVLYSRKTGKTWEKISRTKTEFHVPISRAVTTVRDTRKVWKICPIRYLVQNFGSLDNAVYIILYVTCCTHIIMLYILCANCIVLSARIDRCRRPPTSITTTPRSLRVHRQSSWCIVVLLSAELLSKPFRSHEIYKTRRHDILTTTQKITFETSKFIYRGDSSPSPLLYE